LLESRKREKDKIMYLLRSLPETENFLFSSEAIAVEALIEGGKEFIQFVKDLIDNNPEEFKIEDLPILNRQLKELEIGLGKIQTVQQFNEIGNQLERIRLGNRLITMFSAENKKAIELVSVFIAPDQNVYNYGIITSRTVTWILEEITENELISPKLNKLKREYIATKG
jgi:hypothetical protein